MSVAELVAEFEKDPAMKQRMESARERLLAVKAELGDEAFRDWLVNHFINIEEVPK